jgi:hypothetical protein
MNLVAHIRRHKNLNTYYRYISAQNRKKNVLCKAVAATGINKISFNYQACQLKKQK